MSTRERRREKIAAAILDVSAELLTTHGMEGLTVARIAKAIDYTPGALYRYYPSKDAIIAELHQVFVADLEAELKAALAAVPLDAGPLAALKTAATTYVAYARRHPARFRLFAVALADPRVLVAPEHAQGTLTAYLSLYATVSALFVAAIAEGALRSDLNPATATLAFVLAMQGPLQVDKLAVHAPPGMLDADTLVDTVVDTLLLGWGASPDVPRV
jgi:AcrR family transcriptional regulator